MSTTDYEPSVQQVADLLISRTKDKYGAEVGTFNANTRPTDTQVENLIATLIERVADMIGDDIPEALWDDAMGVVAERVAMQIEVSYYSEQVATSRSPFTQLEKNYETDLARLSRQVQILTERGEDGEIRTAAVDAAPSSRAQGAFPPAGIGFGTRW